MIHPNLSTAVTSWSTYRSPNELSFRNEYGAHAGFTARELGSLIAPALPEPKDVTQRYYRYMHAKWRPALWLINTLRLRRIVYLCVYFVGIKPSERCFSGCLAFFLVH